MRELRIDDGDGWIHVLREFSRGKFYHEITTPKGVTVRAGETWLDESEVAELLRQIRAEPRTAA